VRELGNFKGSVWTPRDGSSHRLYVVDDGEIWTSDDLGENWDLVGDIGAGGNRAAITGSEAGAPTLWVVLDGRDLFRSDDAGKTWIPLGVIDDYWDILAGSIGDPDIVAYGGVELHRSTDGGEQFRVVNRWDQYYTSPEDKLHADMFGLEVIRDAGGGELWLIGTDGGLYESTDRLDTVRNLSLSGLRISQYYSTLTSAADPAHLAAGSQDQGYQITNDVAQTDDLWSFEQAVSGDYGHLSSADGTHAWVFSTYPGFILVQEGESNPFLSYVNFPGTLESSAWIPPVVADPREPENFFFAGDRLWYYEHEGASWQPSLWSDADFQAEQGEYLSALAFAPGDPDRAYGVSSRGRLYWSDDAGLTWTPTKTVAFFDYLYGATIAVSPADPDVATVGGSGYGSPPVFRTEDGGRSWFEYSEGLPSTTVYAIAESLDNRGTLVAGTQTGAWRRDAGDDAWRQISEAPAPVTTYWSVEALPSERTFRFGTYGRGIWDYRLEAGDACWPVVDGDSDGVGCDRDCDDADASISPDAEEKCDGVDVNCNSTDLDENDADGDGKPACDDCDDDDPTDASCETGDDGGPGGGLENEDSTGGCSCGTTNRGPAGAIVLLGALWALRRRRRH
jgi:MYXO-CTERM domain-containing protein